MPSALVVYVEGAERMADAVCAGLERGGIRPLVGPVGTILPEEAAIADLLVVGDAVRAAPQPRGATAQLRPWLAEVPAAGSELRMVAAFHVRPTLLVASSLDLAGQVSRELVQRGYRPAALPTHFRVDEEGLPASPDELYRAYHWGIFAAEGVQQRRTILTPVRVRSARESSAGRPA